MKTVEEMIAEKEIWAGLNRPGISMDEADVIVGGIPFDEGVSFRSGASEAPRALRAITYTICPTTEEFELFEDLKVLDLGDMGGPSRDEIFSKVEDVTARAVASGKLFTFIGGDHSVTIPVLRGIDRALDESFGIVHIDAHFDLCDEMDGDPLSHGSTERRALELENVPGTEALFFVGIRSAETQEVEFMKQNPVNVITARELGRIGVAKTLEKVREKMSGFNKIYVTLDIDCLDPAYAPGTGTPKFGGMTARELLDFLYGLFELPVIGFDVVEVAPRLDESQIAVFAARRIITECWGHHYRKGLDFHGSYGS